MTMIALRHGDRRKKKSFREAAEECNAVTVGTFNTKYHFIQL